MAVHEAFTRNKRAVFQCGADENPGVRLLEIPQWMFDSVACCRMRLATVPTVSCGALLDLKALLRCASFPVSNVVLQSQHRSLLSPGGADAKIAKPTESRSIQTIARLGRCCLQKPDGKQYGCWRDCCASTSEECAPPAAERRRAMSDKIKPHHLERKSILYIRQSSAYQVSHNLESQKLQYARTFAAVGLARDRSCG